MLLPNSALLIVDLQRDFLPSGTLPVPNGHQIVPLVNQLAANPSFRHVYLSKDWHPPNHVSFASNHPDAKPFQNVVLSDRTEQTLWPDHCVQHTRGAEFADGLVLPDRHIVILKGMDPRFDSYSAFFDNSKTSKTRLDDELRRARVDTIYVCGLALDVCVLYTVMDAIQLGFNTVLLADACRGLAEPTCEQAIAKMKAAGAVITTTRQLRS